MSTRISLRNAIVQVLLSSTKIARNPKGVRYLVDNVGLRAEDIAITLGLRPFHVISELALMQTDGLVIRCITDEPNPRRLYYLNQKKVTHVKGPPERA